MPAEQHPVSNEVRRQAQSGLSRESDTVKQQKSRRDKLVPRRTFMFKQQGVVGLDNLVSRAELGLEGS
jgi:hypothetical protein